MDNEIEEIKKICILLKPLYQKLKKEMNMSGQRLQEYFGTRLIVSSREETFEKFLNKLISLCGYVKLEISSYNNTTDVKFFKIIKECPFLISAMMEE
jgi:hypothetical protein